MNALRNFLLLATLAAAVATPGFGQSTAPRLASSGTGASIPDFSGLWSHPWLPGFEPLASGPTSLTNRSRRNGVSNILELAGDYTNPILKPAAAEIVKKFGEISKAGMTFPSPRNQCWPNGLPFVLSVNGMQMFQRPDKITMIYANDHQVRHVRMNQLHPARVTPSWYGDSVGHYEGDTLVIDTVGIKVGRFAMADWYGTPQTEALHVVERYRLLDYEEAKDGLERAIKENTLPQPATIDLGYRGKHLQLHFTVEDPNVFTTRWSATVTFGRSLTEWGENICAENPFRYGTTPDPEVPRADKADF